ncbi:hypothetical protein BJ742DRAFT_775067 [Cladochytrium replicatum]|nr:hypothetical protein BJ742DRAFT_775067 [Cladochytrium replicatum]
MSAYLATDAATVSRIDNGGVVSACIGHMLKHVFEEWLERMRNMELLVELEGAERWSEEKARSMTV